VLARLPEKGGTADPPKYVPAGLAAPVENREAPVVPVAEGTPAKEGLINPALPKLGRGGRDGGGLVVLELPKAGPVVCGASIDARNGFAAPPVIWGRKPTPTVEPGLPAPPRPDGLKPVDWVPSPKDDALKPVDCAPPEPNVIDPRPVNPPPFEVALFRVEEVENMVEPGVVDDIAGNGALRTAGV